MHSVSLSGHISRAGWQLALCGKGRLSHPPRVIEISVCRVVLESSLAGAWLEPPENPLVNLIGLASQSFGPSWGRHSFEASLFTGPSRTNLSDYVDLVWDPWTVTGLVNSPPSGFRFPARLSGIHAGQTLGDGGHIICMFVLNLK